MNQHWEYCWVQEYADDESVHQQKMLVFCAPPVSEHSFDRSWSEVMTLLGTAGWLFIGVGVCAHPGAYEATVYFKRLVQPGRRPTDFLREEARQGHPAEVAQVWSSDQEGRGGSSLSL
jgi:hypothetical protein